MIKAKHHSVIYPLFQWLSSFMMKRNFCSIHIEGEFKDNGHSVLVIANHISWWDGFWVEFLNHQQIHRKFHFMMLEDQLKKHWYFQFTGGYSVKKNSKDILASIDYTIELLNNNENLVLMFPQGKIHSSYNSSVRFEKGIKHIINICNDDTQVLFVVNVADYFSNAKPHLFVYIANNLAGSFRQNDIEIEYNRFLSEVMNQHKTKTS